MIVITMLLFLTVVALAFALIYVIEQKKKLQCDNMFLNRQVNEALNTRDLSGDVRILKQELEVQKALVAEAKVQSDFHFSKYQDIINEYNALVDDNKTKDQFESSLVEFDEHDFVIEGSAVKKSKPGKSTKKSRKNK
jgi:hypothetical protein